LTAGSKPALLSDGTTNCASFTSGVVIDNISALKLRSGRPANLPPGGSGYVQTGGVFDTWSTQANLDVGTQASDGVAYFDGGVVMIGHPQDGTADVFGTLNIVCNLAYFGSTNSLFTLHVKYQDDDSTKFDSVNITGNGVNGAGGMQILGTTATLQMNKINSSIFPHEWDFLKTDQATALTFPVLNDGGRGGKQVIWGGGKGLGYSTWF
jgi:hypothetical protein